MIQLPCSSNINQISWMTRKVRNLLRVLHTNRELLSLYSFSFVSPHLSLYNLNGSNTIILWLMLQPQVQNELSSPKRISSFWNHWFVCLFVCLLTTLIKTFMDGLWWNLWRGWGGKWNKWLFKVWWWFGNHADCPIRNPAILTSYEWIQKVSVNVSSYRLKSPLSSADFTI